MNRPRGARHIGGEGDQGAEAQRALDHLPPAGQKDQDGAQKGQQRGQRDGRQIEHLQAAQADEIGVLQAGQHARLARSGADGLDEFHR